MSFLITAYTVLGLLALILPTTVSGHKGECHALCYPFLEIEKKGDMCTLMLSYYTIQLVDKKRESESFVSLSFVG